MKLAWQVRPKIHEPRLNRFGNAYSSLFFLPEYSNLVAEKFHHQLRDCKQRSNWVQYISCLRQCLVTCSLFVFGFRCHPRIEHSLLPHLPRGGCNEMAQEFLVSNKIRVGEVCFAVRARITRLRCSDQSRHFERSIISLARYRLVSMNRLKRVHMLNRSAFDREGKQGGGLRAVSNA